MGMSIGRMPGRGGGILAEDNRATGVFGWILLVLILGGCGGGGGGGDPAGVPDPPPASPVPCYWADSRCWEQVPVGNGYLLPVYRTHPIRSADTTVTRVVIVVHGAGRNPDSYFDTMIDAASWAVAWEGTLVISPHFQTAADGPGENEATWTSGGWKRGDQSGPRVPSGPTVSSYGALDQVIRFLGDSLRFPNLETVVVTGHSAGGQYTHRFAATSPVEEEFPHLRFRYIVANPSTYLYIGPERKAADGNGFDLPDRAACPNYNEWHYGFEDRNPYALQLTEEGIRARLLGRDVVYLVGTADIGTASLDMSCGAMLQGDRRYPRGLNLFAFLNTYFPQNPHQLFEIAGVAHSSRGMYTSRIGGQVLFQW